MKNIAVINGLILLLSASLAIASAMLAWDFWLVFWPVFVWGMAFMLALVLILAVL